MTLAEQLQDEAAQAYLHGHIGAALAELDRLPEAVAAANAALSLAEATGDSQLIGEQHILLAFVHHDLGDREHALSYCRLAIAAFEASGDDVLATNAQALLMELNQISPDRESPANLG